MVIVMVVNLARYDAHGETLFMGCYKIFVSIIEYTAPGFTLRHLPDLRRGPKFPRDLDGDDSYFQLPNREIGCIVVHHSAGGFYEGEAAAEKIADFAVAPPIYAMKDGQVVMVRTANGRLRRKWIGGGRGWPGCPYTFIVPARPVSEDGRLVAYRAWADPWVTWHTGGVMNRHGVGICVGGWYASRHDQLARSARPAPAAEAMAALDGLVDYLIVRYGLRLGPDTLRCHAELAKPACPGDVLENYVRLKRGDDPIPGPVRQEVLVAGRLFIVDPLQHAAEDDRPLRTPLQIQQALVSLGYDPGELDGDWGPRTANALRAFQLDAGIRADGIFGPVSERAMRQALARA